MPFNLHWKRIWSERHNKLWVLPALHCVLAVVLALVAAWIPSWLPASWELPRIEAKTLDSLLTVIASSMLAVATFSLSIMVSAFASASNSVTPRATELVMGDEGTRTAIANFLSAFMYSVVAQTALGLKYYGDDGRFILFVGTLVVLVWLMVTLLRWVRTLSSLGRLGNTLARVEAAAKATLETFWQHPLMGARAAPLQLPETGHMAPIVATRMLFVRRIDMEALNTIAQTHDCQIHIQKRPGVLVAPGDVLAWVETQQPWESAPSWLDEANAAFHLDRDRTFDQDPRFGVIVLREAAQRALSSSVNDPGTAIACLHSLTRVLMESQTNAEQHIMQAAQEQEGEAAFPPVRYPHLTMAPLPLEELIRDGFDPIVRDGSDSYEVAVRLQKMLGLLHRRTRHPTLAAAIRSNAEFAYRCAMDLLPHAKDREEVQALHDQYFAKSAVPPSQA